MSAAPARVDELKKRYEENPRRFFAPLANEYRKAGELDAAIELCRMHLDEQPGHLSGHIVYGQALFESGRAGEAKIAFEAALNLDPENLIALRHLGDIGKSEGDVAVATHWYQRVLEADPRNDEVIALIADLQPPPPAASVIVVEAPPPPPVPQYAVEPPASVELSFIDPSAPTPVIAMEVVPTANPRAERIAESTAEPIAELVAESVSVAEPLVEPVPEPVAVPVAVPAEVPPQMRPRASIGLMDLDLDLGEGSSPSVDLLGAVPVASAAPPALDEPLPFFSESFSHTDTAFPELGAAESEPLVAADASLDRAPTEVPPPGGFDAEFNIELPDESASTFAAAESESTFAAAESESTFAAAESESTFAADESASTLAAAEAEPMLGDARDIIAVPVVASAPATPADFEALFGTSPISDVFIGGDDEPVVAGEPGFVADAFVGRELDDAPRDPSAAVGPTPPPFVTETMAELYLQQGFTEEALEVYRQLSAQDPGDASLAERVRHLEHGSRSSMAIDRVSQEIEAAAEAEELRHSTEIPAIPEDVVPEVPTTPAAPAAPPAFVGPTAREVFARLAHRRASRSDAAVTEMVEPAQPMAPFVSDVSAAAPAIAATGGSIDHLFGAGTVTAHDEGAAATVAAAFDTASTVTVQGQPTYAGTDEISLESVFHDEGGTARPAPAVERQSTKLRFDQFFAGAGDPPSPSSALPLPGDPGRGEEDIAQFSDWLRGLKGS